MRFLSRDMTFRRNRGIMMENKNKKRPLFVRLMILFLVAILIGGGFGIARIAITNVMKNREASFHDKASLSGEEVAENASAASFEGAETNAEANAEANASDHASTDDSMQLVQEEQSYASARDVSMVVENAQPFIVAINSERVQAVQDFFGFRSERVVKGAGSGIIIGQSNRELLIATNEHVISEARSITVTFDDGSELEAELKGSDVTSDLAVISVRLSKLSKDTSSRIRIATLGDSDRLQVGEMTIAIGNALGYGLSTTVGYVSATDRTITINNVERNLIQTDAAINPGNSGGALLNVRGEVIGINSVKFASTEVERVGFAIPITEAVPIINELMNREELSEREAGYLGVDGQTVTSSYSLRFGIPVGVYINSVEVGSPAQEAGLKPGDIIVKVNGRKVSTKEDLQTVLDYTRAGTTITVTVSTVSGRSYQEVDYSVTLGKR